MLESCQTLSREPGSHPCTRNYDPRPWSRIDEPVSIADQLRALADTSADSGGSNVYKRETWFSLPSGEIMLCRTDEHSFSGEWWLFKVSEGGPSITDHESWIMVN